MRDDLEGGVGLVRLNSISTMRSLLTYHLRPVLEECNPASVLGDGT